MVKVKEFCCGCTLRTGTLILAWSAITWNCIFFLINVFFFLIFLKKNGKDSTDSSLVNSPKLYMYAIIYSLTKTTVGFAVSVIAIWAIQKKKAKYLNGLFWYFCFMVFDYSLRCMLVILDPTLESQMNRSPIFKNSDFKSTDVKILYFVINLFRTALVSYFALVVKSSRDYALRNEAQDDDFERADPIIFGYVNHA